MKTILSSVSKTRIAEMLKPILADQYVLYTKARNYHWNVRGSLFLTLHQKFEELYNELADDIDETAERIRAYGLYAPGSMSEFLKLSELKEETEGTYPNQFEMVKKLADDYDSLAERIRETGEEIQSEFGDEVTAGKLYSVAERYEKHVWLLKSILEKEESQ
ncbi:MAG: DNA starvation/stationary phase protection protein [Melioribacter sp.]|uniref:Dps family protein n=1 Tax=Rosettibacter primus TaxID=3111523 RepID=UPI00247C2CCC|nr:DNA starvation/stationary phase protection protein [Melioribacter sp.]